MNPTGTNARSTKSGNSQTIQGLRRARFITAAQYSLDAGFPRFDTAPKSSHISIARLGASGEKTWWCGAGFPHGRGVGCEV
jgi:hypothetical protein